MINGTKIVVSLFILLLLAPDLAYAYLDPGTGSMLLYAIVGIGVTVLFTLKGLFFHLLAIVRGRKGAENLATLDADIIFHSEAKQYDHLFVPLLEEMSLNTEAERVIAYITQYDRDGLPGLPKKIRHFSISHGIAGFAALSHVKGNMLVTTTPQLNVMMFKRSPYVKHYCHLTHSPTDISMYKPYAFDHFDSVLCPGHFMERSIRVLEKLRGLSEKKLFSTGAIYFDQMKNEKSERERKSDQPCLLIAPSWGSNGLFSRWGTDFLNGLSDYFSVIVRPHPQMKLSQAELFNEVVGLCRKNGYFLDEAPLGKESMERSDLMISDFSGIIFDYSFVYEKPLIIADTEMEYKGFEAYFLNKPLWDEEIRHQIGRVIKSHEISRLKEIIREELAKEPSRIAEVRDKTMANFGNATDAAARQIEELLKSLR
jgi:CDP-glycerol:poly(glycerophosphate) glycerophosphotransferase